MLSMRFYACQCETVRLKGGIGNGDKPMAIAPKIDWQAVTRERNLADARKLVETATAYLAALEASDGDYNRAAQIAEVPMMAAIYAITECDDVHALLVDRKAELAPSGWRGDDDRRLDDGFYFGGEA